MLVTEVVVVIVIKNNRMKCNSPSLAIDNLSKAGSSHPIEEEKQTRQNKQTITAISKLTNWQKHVYIQGLAKCDDVVVPSSFVSLLKRQNNLICDYN